LHKEKTLSINNTVLISRYIQLLILITFLSSSQVLSQQIYQFNRIELTQLEGQQKNQQEEKLYYSLNSNLFLESKLKVNDRLLILTPDAEHELLIRRITEYIPGYTSISAISGDGQTIFSFTESESRINGLMHEMSTGKDILFKYDFDIQKNYQTSKGHEALLCGVQDTSEPNVFQKKNEDKESGFNNNPGHSSDIEEAVTTIDLMIAYTNDARDWAETSDDVSDINDSITQAMNLSQSALDNSGVPIILRLVGTLNIDHNEGEDTESSYLLLLMTCSIEPSFCRFPENPEQGARDIEEFTRIHDRRAETGADLVALFAMFDDIGGRALVLGNILGNKNGGFSVNRIQQAGTSYILMHELGHNLGLVHARNQTTQPASSGGGLFQESVGYLQPFISRATIMAYQGGYTTIPYFSNTSLLHLGFPIGSADPVNRADAVSGLKKSKDIVANYFPSKVDGPRLSLASDAIEGTYNGSAQSSSSFTISNTGTSDLIYFIDSEAFGVTRLSKDLNLKTRVSEIRDSFNIPDTIYSSSFSETEGFKVGVYEANNGWRGSEFGIESNQENQLVISIGEGESWELSSPYFDQLPYGNYRLNIRLKQESTGSNEIILANHERYLWRLWTTGENDQSAFPVAEEAYSENIDYFENDWNTLSLEFNSDAKSLVYLLNDIEVGREEYISSTLLPRKLQFFDSYSADGGNIYVDSLSLIRLTGPTRWINFDKYRGVIKPNESEGVGYTVSIPEDGEGYYELNLIVYSNDLEEPVRVPVIFRSNQNGGDSVLELSQNYPNPFQERTNFDFRVNEPGQVRLEVFDVKGIKVKTLFDDHLIVGDYQLEFNANSLASGVYIYRLTTPDGTTSKKMTRIK